MNKNTENRNQQGLRRFLNLLRSKYPSEIITIKEPVNLEYEITAYGLESRKIGEPVLFFENVQGYDIPIVTNLFASRKRIAMMLSTTPEKFRAVWTKRVESTIEPCIVQTGPVKEVILTGDDVDLFELPIPTYFEQDAGPYITAGVIVANDPDTNLVNLSFARIQVKGKNKCGVSLHSRGNLWDYQKRADEKGKPLDVAIFIGSNPALLLAAGTRKVDEYKIASGLICEPIELVKCETVDIYVPAVAEIVLEGQILPNVKEEEGPFSEFTGYVSGRSTRNVMYINAITRRKNPIFHSILPSNFGEHLLLGGISKQAEIVRVLKKKFPSIVDINWPVWGVHFAAVISIQDASKESIEEITQNLLEQDYYIKLLIIVDPDINIFEEEDVLWAVTTRFQAKDDLTIIPETKGHLLDPSTEGKGLTSKIIIDATKPKGWKFERGSVPRNFQNNARKFLKT